ncbi:MAG TPA: hypothetical protein VF075_13510, partial [Pyrinomonadaceae bacterium]
LGYQSVVFAVFAKTFAISEGLLPENPRMTRFYQIVNLERVLIVGGTMLLGGVILLLAAINQWRAHNFGQLDYAHTMRYVIPGFTLTALGFQTILSGFFVSILGMRRK